MARATPAPPSTAGARGRATPAPPTGLGFTAVGVAAFRAVESARPDRWFADALAARFVRAAGLPGAVRVGAPGAGLGDGALDTRRAGLAAWIALRTRYFDEWMRSTCDQGCSQIVLLGAGLDARAFRLPFARAVTLYELDAPDVIEFKESVLDGTPPAPRCTRIPVATDLRGRWPVDLAAAGWTADRPTAWLAEGLLAYLPRTDVESLLAEVTARSAPGSRLGFSAPSSRAARPWRFVLEESPATWLREHDWAAEVRDGREVAADFGRPVPSGVAGRAGAAGWLVCARRD